MNIKRTVLENCIKKTKEKQLLLVDTIDYNASRGSRLNVESTQVEYDNLSTSSIMCTLSC